MGHQFSFYTRFVLRLEGGVEVEDVGYLEADSVDQDQVSSDEHVTIARFGRRQHYFQLTRTRLHPAAEAWRQSTVHNQLALESGRKTIALGQTARKTGVVGAVPIMEVAVAIFVVAAAVTIAVFAGFMAMTVTMTFIAILPAVAVVIPIVFVVTVAVALGDGYCRGERKRQGCNRAGAEPEL
jgi:hypothetical protein